MFNYRFFVNCFLITLLFQASASASGILPTKDWLVNPAKSKAALNLRSVQTPAGGPALDLTFDGVPVPKLGSPRVVSPTILKDAAANWPKKFDGVGFYLRGDGSGNMITLQFTANKHGYSAHTRLTFEGWKYITIPSLWSHNGAPPLNPRQIDYAFITANGKCEFAIGEINFSLSGVPLSLRIGASGYAVRTNTSPTIDGHINETFWKNCPVMTTSHALRKGFEAGEGKAKFRVAFDNQNVYIAAQVEHEPGEQPLTPKMTREKSFLWEDEALEVFLNPQNKVGEFYQFLCNTVGTKNQFATKFDPVADQVRFDPQWKTEWTVKAIDTSTSWSVEMEIPWKSMGMKAPPKELTFQFMHDDWINDKDKGINIKSALWSPSIGKAMENMGVLKLVNSSDAIKPKSIDVQDIQLKRLEPGKLLLSARLIRPEGQIDSNDSKWSYTAHLANPNGNAVDWQGTVMLSRKETRFERELTYSAPQNGKHYLILDFKSPDDSKLNGVHRIATFLQELPYDVQYGELLLNPKPKELKLGKGEFTIASSDKISLTDGATPRTAKTATFLGERLYESYGIRPQIARGGKSRITLKVDPDALRGAAASDVDEAYKLIVTSDEISIIGGGEAGLYYGVVTLNQLIRSPHVLGHPIQAANIVDWPSLKQRIYTETFNIGVRKFDEAPSLDRIKRQLRDVVAGSKLNVFVFSVDTLFVFKSQPKLNTYPMFTAKDYREIADFARENFIEVVPATSFGSHSLLITRKFPELEEKGFKAQLDVTNPKVTSMLRDIVSDLLDAAGPKTKRFMIYNDEWWVGYKGDAPLTHNGLTRQQIFLNAILEEHDYLKSRGVRMMMFTDMLDPGHNGGPPFNISQVLPKLPKDIILCSWSSTSPKRFKDAGFETLKVNNNFKDPSPNLRQYIDGFGTIAYWLQYGLFSYVTDEKAAIYSWHATIRAAEYAWNIDRDSNLPLSDWTRLNLPNLMSTYGDYSRPYGTSSFSPQEIVADSGALVQIGLAGKRTVGSVPMILDHAVKVDTKGWTYNITKPRTFSGVVMLHGIDFPDVESAKRVHDLTKGYSYSELPVVDVTLNYVDGSEAKTRLRLGVSTIDMKGGVANRYIIDGMYALALDDGRGLIQTEFVNPHPEREVKSIHFEALNKDAPWVLAGITLRDSKPKLTSEKDDVVHNTK